MKLKFSQFVDLVLARLYELEQKEPGLFFDLHGINQELADPVPQNWVFDAGKILESRDLARCIFALGGTCLAQLSGEGRLFVEEERGTGIIKEYHEKPDTFIVNVSGSGNQVSVGGRNSISNQEMTIEKERKPAFQVLEELKQNLESDKSISDTEKNDLLTDVEMIGQQLKKREPNRSALAALLEPLSKVASIAGNVATLIKLLNQ